MSGYGKIYESSYWGVGVCENTIGWGSSYKSIANCTDASFSYPQDSYPTNGVNPTPTITGDAGGTFTATPSGLTLNASTGEITLSTSTVNSYTIRYTLPDATFAEQSMQITAPPFASTQSFSFDGVDDYFNTGATPSQLGFPSTTITDSDFSLSFWYYYDANENYDPIIQATSGWTSGFAVFQSTTNTSSLNFWVGNYSSGALYTTQLTSGNWYHIACVFEGGSTHTQKIYVDGVLNNSVSYTTSRVIHSGQSCLIAGNTVHNRYFNGKLDEFAIWNSALSSDAVTEIYNSGVPNDLDELTNASDPTAWYRMGE